MAKAAKIATAARSPIFAGREFSADGARIAVLAPAHRLALRAPEKSLAALSRALGLKLPAAPKTSVAKGSRSALWLGPDEWLVIDDGGKDPLEDCARVKVLHSAVGVSHRNVGISVTGPRAAEPVARRLSGRRLLAHHPRQGRDRASAQCRGQLPRRMLALLLRLRASFSHRSGHRRSLTRNLASWPAF